MAVSGRKISDFIGSLSTSSSEDFQYSCVPCLSDGQHVEAHGFCADCQEYLCKTCLHCHKKTKASKHHQLLDIDKVGQQITAGQMSDVCTEKCSTHRNEVIKFFCPKHEELGCTDCMTMKHRTCNLDYIPDKCAGIADSQEYKDTLKKLDQEIREGYDVKKRAAARNKEIDAWYDEVIKDIIQFRKEINDHLDKIQKQIEGEAKNRKSTDKQELDAMLGSCTGVVSDIQTLKSSLNGLKVENHYGDLYIALKRARSKLRLQEKIRIEAVFEEKTTSFFECNSALQNILSISNFGYLSDHTTGVTPISSVSANNTKPVYVKETKEAILARFGHKKDINIRLATDRAPCTITSCAVLSSDKLILTDNLNKNLKVVNLLTRTVIEVKELESFPFNVTVLPGDKIAVTMPVKEEIMILRTVGQLSTSGSIKVEGRCRGISYHQDRLYVVCGKPNCVLILDLKGNVKGRIPLEDELVFSSPRYLVLNKDKTLLYVSNYNANTVASVTLQGTLSAVYKGIREPTGMVMLDDESLLVCSSEGSIYRIEADLNENCEVLYGFDKRLSICWSTEKSEVYVGCRDSDQLQVFSLQ